MNALSKSTVLSLIYPSQIFKIIELLLPSQLNSYQQGTSSPSYQSHNIFLLLFKVQK